MVHFLKTEIETKNKIIKNFIQNNSHRDENNNVPQNGQSESLHKYQLTEIPTK